MTTKTTKVPGEVARDKIVTHLRNMEGGDTRTGIREKAGLSWRTMQKTLTVLKDEGQIEATEIVKQGGFTKRPYPGWKLAHTSGGAGGTRNQMPPTNDPPEPQTTDSHNALNEPEATSEPDEGESETEDARRNEPGDDHAHATDLAEEELGDEEEPSNEEEPSDEENPDYDEEGGEDEDLADEEESTDEDE